MNCVAKYKDEKGNIKSFYWDSRDYGSKEDCIKTMEEEGTKPLEILEIWSSD